MLHTLTEVKDQLSAYLKVAGAKERNLKVGQTLDLLNFIKEDCAPLVGKVDTFTLSTLSGPCCGPMRTDGTPAHTAAVLWEKLSALLTLVPDAFVHISNPYIDYTKGTVYYPGANWTTLVDVAIYSYDGTLFKTVRNVARTHSEQIVPVLDVAGHVLAQPWPFKVKVYAENVWRDASGQDVAQYFKGLLSSVDTAVNAMRAEIADLEQRVCLYREIRALHEAALSREGLSEHESHFTHYVRAAHKISQHFQLSVTLYGDPALDGGYQILGSVYPVQSILQMIELGIEPTNTTLLVEEPNEPASTEPNWDALIEAMPTGSRAYVAYSLARDSLFRGETLDFIRHVSAYLGKPIRIQGTDDRIDGYIFNGNLIEGPELLKLIVKHYHDTIEQDGK